MTGLTNERDSLLDQLASLKSELESLKNPGSHPVPDPPKDPIAKTGGPAGALSKDQYEGLLDYIGEQVNYTKMHRLLLVLKGKKLPLNFPWTLKLRVPAVQVLLILAWLLKDFLNPASKTCGLLYSWR